MKFTETARQLVLNAAIRFEERAAANAVSRSVDATESARWLREVASALREACGATEQPQAPSTPEVSND